MATDWVAAGHKAYQTRLRNLAARGLDRPMPPKAPVDWRAAGLKAHATKMARGLKDVPLVIIDDPSVLRQVRRMLASMQEFGFDAGGQWRGRADDSVGADGCGCIEGYQYRQGGDPIFYTIGEVAGEFASRAETIEAIDAVHEGRRPDLSLRLQALAWAVKLVAEGLARGAFSVESPLTGRVKMRGPILPDDFDRPAYMNDTHDAQEITF